MKGLGTTQQHSQRWLICWLLLLLTTARVRADVNFQSPIQFFTNVASRLLQVEMNVDLRHIQIYPTNQYTPAVHRLLQVAANLYDATTNQVAISAYPYLPHVFSPAFRRAAVGTNMEVWISGYVEETDANYFLTKPTVDLTDPFQVQASISPSVFGVGTTNVNVLGIPLIIGAKKGLPNFNEFALENAFYVTRRLEFRRDLASMKVNATNQLYVFNIASIMGVEAWNSYSNAYPRTLQLIVGGEIGLRVSNELGNVEFTNDNPPYFFGGVTTIPANTWPGFTNLNFAGPSFQVPLSNNVSFLQTNILFLQSATGFENVTNANPQPVGSNYPGFKRFVNLRTRLRFAMVDTELNRIVDYVSLDASERSVNLASQLADNQPFSVQIPDYGLAGGWRTNASDGSGTDTKPVGSSRVDLQACKLEYSIVSPK